MWSPSFSFLPFMILGFFRPGLTRKGRLFRPLAKIYSKTLFAAFQVRVVYRGVERIDPERPYVFMANHTSIADPLALAITIPQPFHCVFKKELARIPVFGWALLSLGQIMVDRENTRAGEGRPCRIDLGALGEQLHPHLP